jgi:hypothetical protein
MHMLFNFHSRGNRHLLGLLKLDALCSVLVWVSHTLITPYPLPIADAESRMRYFKHSGTCDVEVGFFDKFHNLRKIVGTQALGRVCAKQRSWQIFLGEKSVGAAMARTIRHQQLLATNHGLNAVSSISEATHLLAG